MKSIKFDLAIISPLKRAKSTFKNSKIKCMNTEYNNLVREHVTHNADLLDYDDCEVFESLTELSSRCDRFLNYLTWRKEKTIVIVTHPKFIKKLLNVYYGNNNSLIIDTAECIPFVLTHKNIILEKFS